MSALLRTYLEEKDETPYAFAKRAQIPCATIYGILSGEYTPSKITRKKIYIATKGKISEDDFPKDPRIGTKRGISKKPALV